MNRIFHVKIAGGTYFLLILLTAVMVFAFWCMKAMIGLVVALGLIIIIERYYPFYLYADCGWKVSGVLWSFL